MSRILHLSDVHLGEPSEGQFLDDQSKSRMAAGDRRAEKEILLETITALDDDGTLASLDAVVISGDLTNKAKSEGFREFGELADRLIGHVGKENILVVPGNHDVPKDHGPGDPARYEGFLEVTRAVGLATPLLDGLDFEQSGALTAGGRAAAHTVRGDDFVIVPLNSSHFCWGTEPLSDDFVEELLSATDKLEDLVKELHQHDVPRVSNAQMTALENLLREEEPGFLPREDDARVRIGVIHHQLLPVSAREEFKAFESITNLGAVRELLASFGVDLVLHGHKHESALYWDYVADQAAFSDTPHRMLVSAAPARFRPRLPVVRIIDIGSRTGARDLEVTDVKAAPRRSAPIERTTPRRARLWDRPSTISAARVVRGASASDVYAMVQSLFAGKDADDPLRYLVCEIEQPHGAEKVPVDYPKPAGVQNVQAWMTDLVDWWRLKDPRLGDGVEFNHGERIHRHWGNQAERAARLLTNSSLHEPTTTRAIILLVDPQTEASAETGEFPSFVLVQLQLVRDGIEWQLDCTGYFRKQEMRYWWPINVAELAKLQGLVAAEVKVGTIHPRPGILRTVTAHALVEERLPAVAVPAIDRALDQRPEDLWRMAYGLIDSDKVADKAELRAVWERFLGELDPDAGSKDDVPRMSHRGLPAIVHMVESVGADDSPATTALRALVKFYALLPADPAESREQAEEALTRLRTELDAQLGEPPK